MKKGKIRLLYVLLLSAIVCLCIIGIYLLMKAPAAEKASEEIAEIEEVIPEEDVVSYDEISYSKAENYSRYDAYKEINPEMETEDVVWRVNANLDMPMYEYASETSGHNEVHTLVNKYYKLPAEYKPRGMVKTDGVLMHPETSTAYMRMLADAQSEGLKLRVVSAYRSANFQESLYSRFTDIEGKKSVDGLCARSGYSEHQTGMALDLFGSIEGLDNFEKTPEYTWVEKNCHKYGFIIRYPDDAEDVTGYVSKPWHIRYVGTDISKLMKEQNIKSFEEYHAKYLQ